MIQVDGLTRCYGALSAVDDLSFTVDEGEVVGFLGPNGAGKSTTMKILTCTLAPTAGRASIAGYDILDDPMSVRRQVGFMPEHVALYMDQTVAGLLEFVAAVKRVPRGRVAEHLQEIMAQTGLLDVRHKIVGNLSHGFRKRVGLAQALVGDPAVLILDEPTSGLDPHQIVEIRELVKSFQGRRTVLFSSHILSEVSEVCQRVLILDRGRLVGQESADGLSRQGAGSVGQRVVLSWEGDRDAVVAALAEVTGVDDLIVTENGAEVMIGGNPVEIRPKLVESVLAAGGRLQNIQDKGPSLEDMFMRLTGADKGLPADAPAADPKEKA